MNTFWQKFEKLSFYTFSNFFLIILVMRLTNMMGVDLHLHQLMVSIYAIIGFYGLTKIRFHFLDHLVFLYILYILLNGLLIDYPEHWSYFYKSFIVQLLPIFCYYYGRWSSFHLDIVFERMKWPIMIAMLAGLYFYVSQPGWYIAMKMEQIDEYSSDYSIQGVFRLSSFWGHPYVIGYSTLLYSLFVLKQLIKENLLAREKLFYGFAICLCIIVLLLAQLRVTIAIFVFSYVYLMLVYNRSAFGSVIKITIEGGVVLFALVYISSMVDSRITEYIIEHITQLFEEDSIANRFEHTAGDIIDYSFWGDGFGRYGFLARQYGKWAIVDHEFQNHLAELGYLGCSILFFILFVTVIRCWVVKQELAHECSLYCFFVLAMFGASILSNHHQFNYVFWFVLGRLWQKEKFRSHIL